MYRAIADYVDLYMNKEEEYEYSVPVGLVNNGTTKVSTVTMHRRPIGIVNNGTTKVSKGTVHRR